MEENERKRRLLVRDDSRPSRTPASGDQSLATRLPAVKRDLVTWAFKYPRFREELLANPKAVVEKELGIPLPRDFEIRVHEEDAGTLYFVIPRNPCAGLVSAERLQAATGITLREAAWWASGKRMFAAADAATDDLDVRLIVRAWQDDSFRQGLLNEPAKAVLEEEATIPEGVALQVVEDTARCCHVILPARADEDSRDEWVGWETGALAAALVAGPSPDSTGLC